MADVGRPSSRVVRVVPDVAGIEAEFDYLVPAALDAEVDVGTIVRVDLAGRHVRGWVVADWVTPPVGKRLLPLRKVSGRGPSIELIDLAGWAAKRWAGKRSFFLQTASPSHNVRTLPAPARGSGEGAALSRPSLDTQSGLSRPEVRRTDGLSAPGSESVTVLRLPPASDAFPHALAAHDFGPTLIIVPNQRAADRLAKRLRTADCRPVALYPDGWAVGAAGGATVVGTRAAAWAPMPNLTSIVVLDAHDEGLQSEASPTWSAVDVVTERARRSQIPLLLVSAMSSLSFPAAADLRPSRDDERQGWAPLHIVDLRRTDPRTGLYSPPLVELLRSERRVVCVLNRRGRARTLVCSACDEIARCSRCDGALALDDKGEAMTCQRCSIDQPVVCHHCGSSLFKQLRLGTARVREDLESLALRPVGEVTGAANDEAGLPDTTALVGTEAVLHRVGRADAVVFLDFDQELLAPRIRAGEDALALLARGSRLVGDRRGGGLVVVQTRQPQHEVLEAGVHGDPSRFSVPERARREALGWPPATAIARVSGVAAPQYVAELSANLRVMGPLDGRYLVVADDIEALAQALATAPRPGGRKLRVEVDPHRI